jgi:hypothetical protein
MFPPNVLIANPSNTYTNWQPFDNYHARLGGAPGARVSRVPERLGGGRRALYQNGAIYERGDGNLAWVYGAINDRYNQLGGSTSWLGFPVADEAPFDGGGRISVFERGSIYFWPDVGAVELSDVVVHYTGLVAFAETDNDQLSSADEPYVILGVVAPSGTIETRSQIYDEVDAGDWRGDLIEIYRGKPAGIVLSALLMEHDFGDPDKYKDVMQNAVRAGFAAAGTAAGVTFPVLAPFIAIAAPAIKAGADAVGQALSGALGTGDDKIGFETVQLTAKQMVVLAARTLNSAAKGVGYKVETPLMTGHGAAYKAYFGLVTA